MKKHLLLLLLFLATSNLFGYKFKVKNQSPGRIAGRITMIGGRGDLDFKLDAGDDKEFDSVGICAADIQVIGISNPIIAQTAKKDWNKDLAWETCKNRTFHIRYKNYKWVNTNNLKNTLPISTKKVDKSKYVIKPNSGKLVIE